LERPLFGEFKRNVDRPELAACSDQQNAAPQTFQPISRPMSSNRGTTRGCLAGRLLSAGQAAGAIDPLLPLSFAQS
jgi:hypothetical protein